MNNTKILIGTILAAAGTYMLTVTDPTWVSTAGGIATAIGAVLAGNGGYNKYKGN